MTNHIKMAAKHRDAVISNLKMPQTFLAQGSGLISFVINWPIFGNAKSGDDTGGYSSNNA